ncbi:hypothetical protein TNCT_593281 [Trichonephila clavata]|uniref:Uncharacterized protein n=1 Tax=Trichonephila clavata TaxID=2740835 RepID=A0A8X6GK08_TRICU|nr:hypothetical protein TNCT_593281 [Trichonephila clavata]
MFLCILPPLTQLSANISIVSSLAGGNLTPEPIECTLDIVHLRLLKAEVNAMCWLPSVTRTLLSRDTGLHVLQTRRWFIPNRNYKHLSDFKLLKENPRFPNHNRGRRRQEKV